jgi:3-hydroxyisobutyrate dehydrogenase-like beta-hydroxyacid dehydrogenase
MAQGFSVVAWNREPERLAPLAAAGASIAASPRDVAERCEVVCLCVLDDQAVRAVIFGADGVAQAGPRERIVVDFSTVDPDETRAIAAQAAAANIRWIDAPVSGGPAAAADGTLTVMVGGAPETVRQVDGVLQAIAGKATHLGDVGSGQAMKVVNQALVGGTFVMLAEVLALVRGLGLPPDAVPSCLEGGLADSVALRRVWPKMVHEDFTPPTGRAAQLLKDLKNVDRLRRAAALELPLLETATRQYQAYVDSDNADAETLSITRLYAPRV